MNLIFLTPVFHQRTWGGASLRTLFSDKKLGNHIGEAWITSTHPEAQSYVEFGEYAGMSLQTLYEQRPDLFGYPKEKTFPLSLKLLDVQTDLLAQVHPQGVMNQSVGWYILEAEPKAKIVLGHDAANASAFKQRVLKKGKKFFATQRVKKADFIYVPSGTIHALGAGMVVLEVKHTSNIVYRFSELETKKNWNKNGEHVMRQAIAATAIPDVSKQPEQQDYLSGKNVVQTLVNDQFLSVKKLIVKENFNYKRPTHYVVLHVIRGVGTINGIPLVQGVTCIITADVSDVLFEGDFEAVVAYVN